MQMLSQPHAELPPRAAQVIGARNFFSTLSVVEEGALANLLPVDGNPSNHLQFIASLNQNVLVIMTDGAIYL